MSLVFSFLCKRKRLPSEVYFSQTKCGKGPGFVLFSEYFISKMLQTNAQSSFVQLVRSLHCAWLGSSAPSRMACEPLKEASPVSLLLHVHAGSDRCAGFQRPAVGSCVYGVGAGDTQFTGHTLDKHHF